MKRLNLIPRSEITLDTVIYETVLFNADTTETAEEAMPFCGNPDGIINPSAGPLAWAYSLQEVMYNNDWRPKEVDMSKDKRHFLALPDDLKESWELVVAGLIFNDSGQTRNLAANLAPFITDGLLLLVLARQVYEEAVHTLSYDVLVKDIGADADRIYRLAREHKELKKRNQFLESMYANLAYEKNDGVTVKDLFIAMIANNILEAMMFYGGFVFLWSFGNTMSGTAQMIAFIARDERMHVLFFRQLFNSTLQSLPKVKRESLREIVEQMVRESVKLEIEWLKMLTKGKLSGFSDTVIERYFFTKGDEIMEALGYDKIYNQPASPLNALELEYNNPNGIKSSPLEVTPKTYSAKKLSLDNF